MKPSEFIIDFCASFEGYHNQLPNGDCTAYPDPGSKDGKPFTIGWGTTTYNVAGRAKYNRVNVQLGDTLTRAQAEAEFDYDLSEVAEQINKLNVVLNQNEFDACVSFFSNCGFPKPMVDRLKRSKTEFAEAMELYVNGEDGKPLAGLVRRRGAEFDLFNTPVASSIPKGDWWLVTKDGLFEMAGDKYVSAIEFDGSFTINSEQFRGHNVVFNMNRAKPEMWKPEVKPESTPDPVTKVDRAKILKIARERCSQSRAHAPGNIIDTEVLDPLRPAMKRLGHMSANDNDGFYNWCAANVTKILRDAGCNVPDIPIVNGKPFWATVALVETWKAWAISKGAWRNSRLAQPGDIVIYDWDGNNVTDHIGIILETKPDGVIAAEGNKNNREAILFRSRGLFAGTINVEALFD